MRYKGEGHRVVWQALRCLKSSISLGLQRGAEDKKASEKNSDAADGIFYQDDILV